MPAKPEPEVVPVPPAAEPVEVSDAAVAVRVGEDGAPEVGHPLFPGIRNEVGILEALLQHPDIQENFALLLETLQVLFATHVILARLQSEHPLDLGEIDLNHITAVRMLHDVEIHERRADQVIDG